MTLFLVVGTRSDKHAELEAAIKAKYPDSHYHVKPGVWIVADRVTAKEVSNALGITDKPVGDKTSTGPAIVASLANYWGRGSTEQWEWMKSRTAAD